MRELYTGGVAIHGGPESCVGVREDGGEALAGVVWAGLLSRENQMKFRVLTSSHQAEGHVVGGVIASCWRTLRGRRTWARTKSPCARTGRSYDHPSCGWGGSRGER
jgi:hypothetical protein